MTKKTYRWIIIGGAVFLTIAFIGAVILSVRSTRKASAAGEGVQVSVYDSQVYSYSPIVYSIDGEYGFQSYGENCVFTFYTSESSAGGIVKCQMNTNYSTSANQIDLSTENQQKKDISVRMYTNAQDGSPTDDKVTGIKSNAGDYLPEYYTVTTKRTGKCTLAQIQSSNVYYKRTSMQDDAGTWEITFVFADGNILFSFPSNLRGYGTGSFLMETRVANLNIDTSVIQNNAYNSGFQAGVNSQQPKINSAREEGYNSGYAAGVQQTSSLGDILLGIGGVPFETLQSIFDFDLLGINISSLVMSILTAAIAIWIVKLFI